MEPVDVHALVHAPLGHGEGGFAWFFLALKAGAVWNALLLRESMTLKGVPTELLYPAQIFLAVSIYRCLLPNRYDGNIVLYRGPWSSSLVTRVLATFSEISWIFQLSVCARAMSDGETWITIAAYYMVAQVVVSQCFVWVALLTGRDIFFFLEELGWAVIFVINTAINAHYYLGTRVSEDYNALVQVSVVFGVLYLPWQLLGHLPDIYRAYETNRDQAKLRTLAQGVEHSYRVMRRSTEAADWGGVIGVTWALGYWVAMPHWLMMTVRAFQS